MDKYLRIKEQFETNKDNDNAIKMAAYMRNMFSFYGLLTPERKAVYKEFLSIEKKNKEIDWKFIEACYSDEHREFQYLVLDYLTKMNSYIDFEDLSKIKRYIQTKSWWDTIDEYAKDIVGNMALRNKEVGELMLAWSIDEDFWVRRTAILHQICKKDKTNAKLLEQIITNNFGSSEFFINKAIGWSLRDYSKTNPEWVRDFVETYKEKMVRL